MLLLCRLSAEVLHWRVSDVPTVAQHNQSTSSAISELLRPGKNMLFNPTGLVECLREWEDLEKNHQQIQVKNKINTNKTELEALRWKQSSGRKTCRWVLANSGGRVLYHGALTAPGSALRG